MVAPYGSIPSATQPKVRPAPSKDSDARQEDLATRPSDRDRSRAAACGRHRRRDLLGRQYRPRLLPADDGLAQTQGPRRPGEREAGRKRNPPDLRGQGRGPLPGSGLCPGPGPLLGDGRTPPHDRRASVGDVRRQPGGDRRLLAHARMARGRGEGVQATPGQDQGLPQGLLGGCQRLPQEPQGLGALRRVRGTRPGGRRLQAALLDTGRLRGLAQGDGLGPARQHVGRDRQSADVQPH